MEICLLNHKEICALAVAAAWGVSPVLKELIQFPRFDLICRKLPETSSGFDGFQYIYDHGLVRFDWMLAPVSFTTAKHGAAQWLQRTNCPP